MAAVGFRSVSVSTVTGAALDALTEARGLSISALIDQLAHAECERLGITYGTEPHGSVHIVNLPPIGKHLAIEFRHPDPSKHLPVTPLSVAQADELADALMIAGAGQNFQPWQTDTLAGTITVRRIGRAVEIVTQDKRRTNRCTMNVASAAAFSRQIGNAVLRCVQP